LREPGSEAVREHAAIVGQIACCETGRVELAAVFHRHLREGRLSARDYRVALQQFDSDLEGGVWRWLPLDTVILLEARKVYDGLSSKYFLRAADAVHLTCARTNGCREVFTNDRHMLAACPAFGLKGRNLIA
jgi:predicted nucleic acid-binding protein